MKNITAVILAAGMGTRMKTDLPKVLHPVASQTMLGRTISSLKKAGVEDIIAVIGYKAEVIEEHFKDRIRFVRQPELLGSGDALAHAVDFMGKGEGKVLVTCGDTPLITAETFKKMKAAHMKEGVSCVLLTCCIDDPSSYGRIMRDKKGEVTSIVEEKDLSSAGKKINEINVGTYCFKKSELKNYIRQIELNEKKKEFYLTDIVDILKKNRKKIVSVTCGSDEYIGVNSRRELAAVNRIAYRRKAEEVMDSGVTLIDPDTAYIDDSAVIGRDTVIYPNTVIESGVAIGEGCKIGPFARLRPGTKLEDNVEVGNFVELCRTTVGRGSKVKHHTYLGDTVVGEKVNIGAGTITANYDGKNKNRTVIEDGAFIGVGAVLIAPVKIGANAIVGAGTVVTKNRDVKAGETGVGIPARPLGNKKKEK